MNELGPYLLLLLIFIVMILCMGIALGIGIEQEQVLDTVCINTYQNYKDVITCQESKLDYSKIIIKEQ